MVLFGKYEKKNLSEVLFFFVTLLVWWCFYIEGGAASTTLSAVCRIAAHLKVP